MLRSPVWPGTASKRPSGSRARSRGASARNRADPAGRWPTATWARINRKARPASKRSTRAAGTGPGAAAAGRSRTTGSPPPISGKPLTAMATSPAPSASCTTSATTSTRTDGPPLERWAPSVVCRHRLEQRGEPLPCRLAAAGQVLAGHPVGGRLVAAQDPPSDGLAVHLVGAVVEARGTCVAVHRLQRKVGRVAERAVHLQRPVDHVVQHAGAIELD